MKKMKMKNAIPSSVFFTTLGEGGCMPLIIGICTALCAVMIAGIATCLQIVQIAFAWQYAFPGDAAEPAANPVTMPN